MSYKRRSEKDSQPVGKQDRYASDHDDDVIIIETGGSSSPEDDLPAISVTTPQTRKTSKSHIQSTQPVNRPGNFVFHTYHASHELGTPPLQRLPSSHGKKEIVTASEMILTKYTHKGNSSSSSRRPHLERERSRERRCGYIQNVPQDLLSSGGRKSSASTPRATHSSGPILNSSTVGSNKLPSKISGRPSQHVAHPVPASRRDPRNVLLESFLDAPMSTNSSTNILEKARKSPQLASRPKAALGMEHVRRRESLKTGQSLDSRDKGSVSKRQRVLSPDLRGNGVQERKNGGQRERKHSLGSLEFQRNKVPSVSHPKVSTKPAVSSTAQVVKKAVPNGQEAAISKVANVGGVMDTSINTQSPSIGAYRSREKGGIRANLTNQISKQQGKSVAKKKGSHSFAVSSSRDSSDPKQKSSSGKTQKRDAKRDTDLDKRVAPAKWTLSTGTISTSFDSVTTTAAGSQSGVVVTAKATTNSEGHPPSLSKKDSDTETSSIIGFNDDDLFEILDSVETDSICSAYNQSDSESLGTSSESYCSKLTSEPDRLQPSNLTKSVSCKSPSESRLHDFAMSFVKKRPRVARKSTTWNGAKFYKHPIKGGLLRLKRHCTLKLRRVKCTRYLSKLGQNSAAPHDRQGNRNKITCSAVKASATTESDAGDITPPLAAKAQVSNDMKKKRESKELPPNCVKRLKLSSECEPSKPTLTNFNGSSTVKPSMQKKVTSSPNHIEVSSAGNGRTVTPEKNHTSSGLATPVSKKCLSLKRLQLSRTPSLSDAPTENQPLSPPFLSPSSSVGRASTQEKQGNSPAHFDPKTNPAQQQSNSNPTTSQPHAVDTVTHVEGEERLQGTGMASGDKPSSVFTGIPSVRYAMCGTSENVMATTNSEQVKHVACGRAERPLSTSSDENNSLAKLSQRDEAYDLRLMETIAKLAPESDSGGSAGSMTTTHTRSSVSSVQGEEEMEVQSERDEGGVPMLTVKVPLAQLSRTPSVSPSVTTRAIGMFTDKAVQADQGMIVDKDVLDAYLVVKLHEAMFDMKEQLRMMEIQVAAIAKQKENLERMLQSKTQYIRDMVTTGFKRGMEDKETSTDSSLFDSASSSKRGGATATVATQTKRLRIPSTPSKDRKGVKMVAKGTQTDTPDYITVSSQTEGMVRVTPARLETPSQPLCLYRHPDSEMQIYIEQVKHNTSDSHIESESVEENIPISNPNQQWLSGSVVNGCSRSVAVNPKVRFLRALRDSTAFVERFGCARCIPSSTIVTSTTPQPTPEKAVLPKVQFSTNADTSSDSLPVSSEACQGESVVEGRGYDCIPPCLCSSISKLVDLYCKLKALPKQPVQARHMMSLLKALHHLLSHLPVEIEPLLKNSPPKSAVSPPVAATAARDAPPSTPTNTTTSSTPTTPPSSERPSSSPPSTPGAATWSMGAKLQELMEALHELEEKGRELLPKYFKGELARLQLMVQNTLTFFTSGIQHETFTHDQSGCIVNSDLQPRPWRDQDLQRNPYFRRLCLDVGVRGIIQQVRKLSQQNRQGKRKYSTDDSDLDSDFDIPSPSVQRGTKPTSRRGKIRVTREKMKDMKDKARKKVFHVTLPLPSSSRGEDNSTPSTSESSTPATSTSSPPTSTAVCISPSTSPPFSSPSGVSPYSKRITKGETLQVRVAELQSKVKCSVQPVSSQQEAIVNTGTVPSRTMSTTVSLTSQSIPSIPSNLDGLGGNVNAQYMLSQYIHQHLGRKLSTGPPVASQGSVRPVTSQQGMVNASIVVSKPVSTTCTLSLTSQSIPSAQTASQTVQSLLTLAATKTAPRPPAAPSACSTHLYKGIPRLQRDGSTANQPSASATDIEGASLRKVIDVLLQVFHTVQITPPERLALQRMIEHAYQLVSSAEYDIVKQLIANISYHLHTALSKTMPQFQSGAAVVARPLPTLATLPLMTPMTFPANIYPTLPSSILPCVSTHMTPLLPPHRMLSHPNIRSGPVMCAAQSAAQGRLPPTTTVTVSQSATNPQPPQPLAVREVVQSTAVTTSTVDTTATSGLATTDATTSTSTGTISSKPIEKTPPSSTIPPSSSVTSTAPPSQVSESQCPTKRLGEKTLSTPSTTVAASAEVCSSSSGDNNSPVLTSEGTVVPLRIARIENAMVSGSSSSADDGLENLLTTTSVLPQREPSVSSATSAGATTLVSTSDSLRVTTSTCTSTSSPTTSSSTSISTAHPLPSSGVPTSTIVPVSNVSSVTLPSSNVSIVTTAHTPSSSVSNVATPHRSTSTSAPSSTVTTVVTAAQRFTSSSVPSSTAVAASQYSTSTASSSTAVTAAQRSTSSSVPSSTAVTTAQRSTSSSVPSSTAVAAAQYSTSTASSSTAVTAAQRSISTSASSSTSVSSVTAAHHSNKVYTRPVEVPSVVSQGYGAHVKQPVTQRSTTTSAPSSTVTTAVTTAQCSTSTSAPSSTTVTTAQCSTSSSVPSSTAVTTAPRSTSSSVPSSTAVTTAPRSASSSVPSSTAVTTAQRSASSSVPSSTAVTTAQRSTSSSVPSSTAVAAAQYSTSTASSSTAVTAAQHSTSTSASISTGVTSVTTAHRSNKVYTRPVEVPSVVSQGYTAHIQQPATHSSPPSSLTNPTLHQFSHAIQQCPQPVVRSQAAQKSPPPAVKVQASKVFNGLLIKWTLPPEYLVWQNLVVQYDLYAFVCNNKDTKIPDVSLWCKVGEIKPLALPMAVTLTNFAVGQRYAFSVRAKYLSGATSDYSEPCTIDL